LLHLPAAAHVGEGTAGGDHATPADAVVFGGLAGRALEIRALVHVALALARAWIDALEAVGAFLALATADAAVAAQPVVAVVTSAQPVAVTALAVVQVVGAFPVGAVLRVVALIVREAGAIAADRRLLVVPPTAIQLAGLATQGRWDPEAAARVIFGRLAFALAVHALRDAAVALAVLRIIASGRVGVAVRAVVGGGAAVPVGAAMSARAAVALALGVARTVATIIAIGHAFVVFTMGRGIAILVGAAGVLAFRDVLAVLSVAVGVGVQPAIVGDGLCIAGGIVAIPLGDHAAIVAAGGRSSQAAALRRHDTLQGVALLTATVVVIATAGAPRTADAILTVLARALVVRTAGVTIVAQRVLGRHAAIRLVRRRGLLGLVGLGWGRWLLGLAARGAGRARRG